MAARSWVLRLHRWFGLTLCFYAVAIGLSGSILVFRDELTALAYPELHRGREQVQGSPDSVVARAESRFPGWHAISVTWPNQSSPLWMAYLLREGEAKEVFVDGAGELVGSRNPASGWIGWLRRLHVNFHGGSIGRLVNGIGAMALLGMSLTGAVLWWPPRFRWTLKTWHVHYWTGSAAAVFIAIVSFTGGYYVWPQSYISAVDRFFDRTTAPVLEASAGSPLPLHELAVRAQQAIPEKPLYRISVPGSAADAVYATMLEGAPDQFHKVSTVILHPVTGAVMRIERYEMRAAGNSVLAWFSVLHFGRFGGLAVKTLWSLLGLSLAALSITGVMLWWPS